MRVGIQGFGHDQAELAAEAATQSLGLTTPAAGNIDCLGAGDDTGRRHQAGVFMPAGAIASEQFVQQHAQGVNIGGSGDRAAIMLLGCGIGWREQVHAGAGGVVGIVHK